MLRSRYLLLVGSLACYSGLIFGQTWKPLNGGLPKQDIGVSQVLVSVDATVAYAITSTAGLLRKSGSSDKWKPVDGVVGVTAVAIAPSDSSVVYAGTGAGLRESSDRGATWRSVKSGSADARGTQSIAVDPTDAATAYAVIGYGILKTTDAGDTWTQAASFSNSNPVITITLDPSSASTLYVTTLTGGILKSTDGGQTWASIKAPLQDTVFTATSATLTIDPKNPSTLYAGSFFAFTDPPQLVLGTISKSSNGGQTWTTFQSGLPAGVFIRTPAIDAANSMVLYSGFEMDDAAGILKSSDGGQTWSQVYATSGVELILSAGSAGSGIQYAAEEATFGGSGGILVSADEGQNWTADNQGLGYFNLGTLALDPSQPDVVYAGGIPGLFRKDKGSGFTSLPMPAAMTGVVSLAIDPGNPQISFMSVTGSGCYFQNQLLFKSIDGGNTWNSSVSPSESGCLSNSPLLVDPHNPQTVYVAENDYLDGGYGLLQSADGGATWNALWSGASAMNLLVADASHAGTLYAGLEDYLEEGDPAGLFKSADGGATWKATGLADMTITALAIDPSDSNTLFASSAQSVYKSSDGGGAWSPLTQGLTNLATAGDAITALAIDPVNPATVFFSTSAAGIYVTTDGGATWASFNNGLATTDVHSLAVSPADHQSVYALTAQGVFRLAKQ